MMGRWQSRFVWLAVPAILAAHSVAKAESRFLTSAKDGDTTMQDIRSRALPAVSKEESLPKLENQKIGSRKVYTAKRLMEGKAEGEERSTPREDGGSSTEVKKDGANLDQTKDTVKTNVEGEVGKDGDQEKEAAEAEPVGQAVTDLLLWYLSPYLLPRLEQAVPPPQPVLPHLAHDAVATPPLAPNFYNFSTLPSYPSFVVAPTLPETPQPTLTPTKENKTEDSSTHKPRIREAKGSRPISESLPAFPFTVWLELTANALSDDDYQIHIQRQMSPPAQSSDFSARVPVEDEAELGADRIEEVQSAVDGITEHPNDTDIKKEFNENPLKAPLLLNPLPAFKMNKSMRPYVSSPIPLSPFYTFDKPPHFFPSFDFPPAETTVPSEEPTADSAEGGNLQAEAFELKSIEYDGIKTSDFPDRADR